MHARRVQMLFGLAASVLPHQVQRYVVGAVVVAKSWRKNSRSSAVQAVAVVVVVIGPSFLPVRPCAVRGECACTWVFGTVQEKV
jgi:hypothetical protein